MEEKNLLGELLRGKREVLEITQKDLCKRIYTGTGMAGSTPRRLSPRSLEGVESGAKWPSDIVLWQLCMELKINVDYAFYLAGRFAPDIRDLAEEGDLLKAMGHLRRQIKKR